MTRNTILTLSALRRRSLPLLSILYHLCLDAVRLVYHQDYFHKNPHDAYCRINIPPKLEKLEKLKAVEPKP